MLDRPVDTPTLKHLKALRQRRMTQPYVYRLTDEQVRRARRDDLPDSALLALAAITAAAYGARRRDWVTLPARTVDAIGRGYRWWHRHQRIAGCGPHRVRAARREAAQISAASAAWQR